MVHQVGMDSQIVTMETMVTPIAVVVILMLIIIIVEIRMKLEMVEGSIMVVVEEAEAAEKKNNSYYGDVTFTAYSSRHKRFFLPSFI
jgi:cell division protein FtsL